MNNIEKVKKVREMTLSPINKITEALQRSNWDVGVAVELLVKEKQADAHEMANRTTSSKIVYSYVHNNRIGAMVVLACQTDFVARTDAFLMLAKDICMHIVSTPVAPEYVSQSDIQSSRIEMIHNDAVRTAGNKPPQVIQKIVDGKLKKFYNEVCLVNQSFVRDDTLTIGELINIVSSTLGEKIEVKSFVKMVAQ